MNGEGINQSFRDLPQAWSSMGRSRQIGFAVGAVVVIAALFSAFVYLQPPATVPLYTNLAEGGGKRVHDQKRAGERFADTNHFLDHFGGLHRTDRAGY